MSHDGGSRPHEAELARELGLFDTINLVIGYPVGGGWDEVTLPEIGDPNAYALEVSGDSMEPVFRDGDMVIVSPAASSSGGARPRRWR